MLTVNRAPRVGVNVEFDHKNQDYKYSLLLDQYRCLLMFENTDCEQITTEFRVIGIFTNQCNQKYILQDQIFHPFVLTKNVVGFRVFQKDKLMFFNCINGQFSENLNEKSILINQDKELLIKPTMRNLYLNQAMTIKVTKNEGIIILVEGTMFNINKLFVQVYSNTLNLIFQNQIEIEANYFDMQLYPMNDQEDSFIICKQCFEQNECLNFYLYGNQKIQHIKTAQKIGDLTIVDAIGYNNNQSDKQSNSIIFLCNQNPIGNPKLLISDYLGQNTSILELNLKWKDKEYATVLEILFQQNERFAIHYEMQVSVDENGDFIQVVQISEDLKSLIFIADEIRSNRENSISEYKFGTNGFIEIPTIWECYTENYQINEYQVNSVDQSQGNKIEQLEIERKLIYFNQFPDVFTFAYHFMNKNGILNNLGINVCEDVIMKLKEQNEEQK